MKTAQCCIFGVFVSLASAAMLSGEQDNGSAIKVNHGPWPIDKFCSIAANYYQGISKKKLDDQVVTLNDLGDVKLNIETNNSPDAAKSDLGALKARWGKKSQFLAPLYHVVESDDAVFKVDFKEIFGKSIKYYQAVCISYPGDERADKNSWRVLDPTGLFELASISTIDLWLMDEDGKCYVILSYEPARGFKGNLTYKVLERIGIRNAKLWK